MMEDGNLAQGTEAWKMLRCGCVTASRLVDVMSKGRGKEVSAGVRNYRAQLVAERLTGEVEETYCSADMARGTELEPLARNCYSFFTGFTVDQVAIIPHPRIEFFKASPDGLIGSEGMCEIKCCKVATHIEYLLGGVVPKKYVPQMTAQLSCSGRKWNDFVSYCPSLPENMQIFIKRLSRDEKAIEEMENAVIAFNLSVERMIEDLTAQCG